VALWVGLVGRAAAVPDASRVAVKCSTRSAHRSPLVHFAFGALSFAGNFFEPHGRPARQGHPPNFRGGSMMTNRTPDDRSPVDLRSGNALLSDTRRSLR
jgi:hypothetical protein